MARTVETFLITQFVLQAPAVGEFLYSVDHQDMHAVTLLFYTLLYEIIIFIFQHISGYGRKKRQNINITVASIPAFSL